jgi:D-alanine transaminase
MIVYFNGDFIPKDQVRLSPDDRGFLFADGVYEVIRYYNGKPFKADEHLRRLERSLTEIRIAGVDIEPLAEIAERLLQKNDLETRDATVYIQITRGTAPRKHAFPDNAVSPTVYLSAAPFQRDREKEERGVKVILVPDIRWSRCDIKSVALLPNALAAQQAKERGAEEAIFVRDGVVTEGSHSNFAAVFDGRVMTHPKTNHILGGITRDVTLDLCRRLGIPVGEFPVFERELTRADEMMLMSTTAEVMPIVQVNDWQVRGGKPGAITRRLQQAFREVTP